MSTPAARLDAVIRTELSGLDAAGLLRHPLSSQSSCDAHVTVAGRDCINAASNNALGLSADPRVRSAAAQAAQQWGAGSGASRLVSGTLEIHRQLEEEIARFKHAQRALVFPTGYMANVGTITALAHTGDTVIVDKLAHASIIDGARLSGARLRTFAHNDPDHLRTVLGKSESGRQLVVTESIFSMDGDAAPLADIASACEERGAILMVDEAHATGVLGPTGAGLIEELGLSERVPVSMGTLSKALGSQGGFVAGSSELVAYLENMARAHIYTTALAPACVGAAREALRLVREEPWRRERVCAHALRIYQALERMPGRFHPLTFRRRPAAHIVPAVIGSNEDALARAEALRAAGVIAPAIRPPTVPAGTARLRVSCMATHTDADIDAVIAALAGA